MICASPNITLLASAAPSADQVPAWIWLLVIAAGIIATVTDIRSTRIPNWLTLPLLLAGLVYWTVDQGWSGLGTSAGGAAIAGFVFIILYAMFGGGAGDAKIMMAFGAWLGPEPSKVLIASVNTIGFLYGLSVTIYRGGIGDVPYLLMHSYSQTKKAARNAIRGKFGDQLETPEEAERARTTVRPRPSGWIPYAPAILVGTIAAWWYWETYGPIGGTK
jgi:prepilin peptidase CpaA